MYSQSGLQRTASNDVAHGNGGRELSSNLKIVVVENEKDIRDMMRILLEMDGREVITVSDGERAVQAIESEAPDLAFLDIGLPKMDGYAVMERLCEQGLNEITFCVALIGFGQQRDVKKSVKAGFRHRITKPVCAPI